MRKFPGKIHFVEAGADDLIAVISIDDARLQISAGDTPVGEWPITDIELHLGTRGYHVTLDGEEVVLAPHDRFGFTEAVEDARQHTDQSPRQRRKAEKKRAKEEARRAKAAKVAAKEAAHQPAAPVPAPADPTDTPPKGRRTRTRRDDPEPERASTPKKRQKPAKPATRRARRRNRNRPDPDAPKPVPHIPGLEDPDKDALWATQRTQEPGGRRRRRIAILGGGAVLVLVFFAPAVVALMFLIPGVAAVILASLSMLDPAYARFVPGAMTEVRLMVAGIGFFAASLIITWIF